MESVGEDDPYGDLVKFCRPTSSQAHKLQSCHFARADEIFPAALDSLGSSFSQAVTQSPPPVIAMVSLSDSDEDEEPPNDENTPVDNDEYQTPPEEHNTSYCSSQEEIKRNLQLVLVAGEKTEAEIENDGDSAPGLEIIELPEQLKATRDGGLNEFGISGENSGEPPWKKIRVSGVNWESPMPTVEEEEVIASQQASDYAADVDHVDGELIDMVIESDEETDGAGSDEEMDPDGAGSDEEIGLDGAGNDDGEGMTDCVKNGGEKSVSSGGDLVVEEVGNGKKSVSSGGDLVVEEVGNGKKSVSSDGKLVEEVGNGKKSVSSDGKLAEEVGNGKKSVSSDGKLAEEVGNGKKSVSSDGKLAKEVGNGKKIVSSDGKLVEEVGNGSGFKSAGMDREDIYAFKYKTASGGGRGENGDQRWKEVARKKRELPVSMKDKGSDREVQKGYKVGDNRNVDAKVLSWKELFERLAKMVKNKKGADCDAEKKETDFLETAKRKGMTFPTPRWKTG